VSPQSVVTRAREVALGSQRRLGLWILPLFVMVALLALRSPSSTTASASRRSRRRPPERAPSSTRPSTGSPRPRRRQRTPIAELVRQVRESLAEGPPIDSPNDVGIYAVSAAHPGGEVRVGSGFVLLSDRDGTAVVTNYRVVATPDGFALGGADVHLPQGTFTARVHSFDRDRDLAVLVLSGGPLPVPEWRPADERVTRGDLVYLAGIAGPGTAAVVGGKLAAVSTEAIVTTLPVNAFVAGGPLLDVTGRGVAISSLDYARSARCAATSSTPCRSARSAAGSSAAPRRTSAPARSATRAGWGRCPSRRPPSPTRRPRRPSRPRTPTRPRPTAASSPDRALKHAVSVLRRAAPNRGFVDWGSADLRFCRLQPTSPRWSACVRPAAGPFFRSR
jgi:S1-C subfamily serine protease